jgi:hypothetical protein
MDNTYNIDFIARCIAGHNKTAIKSITTELENVQKQIGGVSLVEITQEDYDALTDKDPSTIYLVSNGDKITLYIGGGRVGTSTSGLMKMKALNTQYSRQGVATFRNFE